MACVRTCLRLFVTLFYNISYSKPAFRNSVIYLLLEMSPLLSSMFLSTSVLIVRLILVVSLVILILPVNRLALNTVNTKLKC